MKYVEFSRTFLQNIASLSINVDILIIVLQVFKKFGTCGLRDHYKISIVWNSGIFVMSYLFYKIP